MEVRVHVKPSTSKANILQGMVKTTAIFFFVSLQGDFCSLPVPEK